MTVVMGMSIALGATIYVAHVGTVGALAGLGPIGPFAAAGVVVSSSSSLTKTPAQSNVSDCWRHRCYQ